MQGSPVDIGNAHHQVILIFKSSTALVLNDDLRLLAMRQLAAAGADLQAVRMSSAEQSRAEQSRAEQSRAEQSRAEQSRAEQTLLPTFVCDLPILDMLSLHNKHASQG